MERVVCFLHFYRGVLYPTQFAIYLMEIVSIRDGRIKYILREVEWGPTD